MARAVGVFLAAFFVAQTPPRDAAPPPTSGTGIIRGRVVAAVTGDPIRNARVSMKAGRDLPPVLTDAEGRFAFPDLPGTKVTITASKPGFAKASVDVIRATAGSVVIALQRGAAISGVVMDDAGEPVPGVSVMVEPPEARDMVQRSPVVGITDDLGRYRIGGLSEGRVVVSVFAGARNIIVLPNGAGTLTSGPFTGVGDLRRRIYYPGGSKSDEGEPVSLQPGDEKLAIDFVVPASLPAGPRVAPAQHGQTAVSGRVLSEDGQPVRGAQVMLEPIDPPDQRAGRTVTDPDGAYQFVWTVETSGTFRIRAGRTGYLTTGYGQKLPSEPFREVTIVQGQLLGNLDIDLGRPGVVSGRIFDENGDPVEGASVRAMRVTYSDGRRQLRQAGRALAATDDLGRYRVPGLPPGRFFISAAVGQIIVTDGTADLPGYGETYYPGSPNAGEAQAVSVGRSDDITGVDFPIAHVKTARVAGRSLDSDGGPGGGALALMPSRRSGSASSTQFGARIESDGRFEFVNVPPGDFVLQASRHRNGSWNEGESETRFVTVNGEDITDIELRTTPGSTISGHISVDDGSTLKPGDIDVSAVPTDTDLAVMLGGGAARAKIDKDLRFEMAGIHGPRRLRVMRLTPVWALKAILLNGSDITDAVLPFGRKEQSLTEVEVVVTTRVSEIAGAVVDDRNRPVADAAVVAFAQDRALWYPSSRFVTRADVGRDGTFSIRDAGPASYYVALVDKRLVSDVGSELENPDFLESLVMRSQRVTLDEGQHISITLRLSGR